MPADPNLDALNAERIRLETTIAKLQNGVASYRVGDREIRYQDLSELNTALAAVKSKIAMHTGKFRRNIPIHFRN